MILAFDLGGTSIKYGLVDKNGTVFNENSIICDKNDYKKYINKIIELCKKHDDIKGIAISAPGGILEDGTTVGLTAIPCIENQNIKRDIFNATNKITSIANDANCTIMSELFDDKNMKNGVSIVIGSGIGGGIFVNGELILGKEGISSEFGVCYQGIDNKMERMAFSTVQMENLFKNKTNQDISFEKIFEKFKKKEEIATNIVNDFFRRIAILVYNIESIIHPEKIVFAGGITNNSEFLKTFEKFYNDLQPYCEWNLRVEHKVSKFKSLANLPGAAAYWLKITDSK